MPGAESRRLKGWDNEGLLRDPLESIPYMGSSSLASWCRMLGCFSQEAGGVGAQLIQTCQGLWVHSQREREGKPAGDLELGGGVRVRRVQGAGPPADPPPADPLPFESSGFHSFYVSIKREARPAHQCPKCGERNMKIWIWWIPHPHFSCN